MGCGVAAESCEGGLGLLSGSFYVESLQGGEGLCRQARFQGKVHLWAFGEVNEVETKHLQSRVRAPVLFSLDLLTAL